MKELCDLFGLPKAAGTPVTGNIDPLEPIAEVARQRAVWLHVDAIWEAA